MCLLQLFITNQSSRPVALDVYPEADVTRLPLNKWNSSSLMELGLAVWSRHFLAEGLIICSG